MDGDLEVSSSVATRFIRRVVPSMVAARCVVTDLHVGPAHDRSETRWSWGSLFSLETLDLSDLRTLVLDPRLPPSVWEDDPDRYLPILRRDIHSILKTCASTLERLECRTDGMAWFIDQHHLQPVHMPNLKLLQLGSCDIESTFFKNWMAKLPNLIELRVEDMRICRLDDDNIYSAFEPINNWRNVFEAMRIHPSLCNVHIESIGGMDIEVFFDKRDMLAPWKLEDRDYYSHEEDYEYYKGLRAEVERAIDSSVELTHFLEEHSSEFATHWIMFYACGKIEWFGMHHFEG